MMRRKLISLAAGALAAAVLSGTSMAADNNRSGMELGILKGMDSGKGTITINSTTYKQAVPLTITSDMGRRVDPYALPPGQPINYHVTVKNGVKMVDSIHIFMRSGSEVQELR